MNNEKIDLFDQFSIDPFGAFIEYDFVYFTDGG